jgi:hypothetical protein
MEGLAGQNIVRMTTVSPPSRPFEGRDLVPRWEI